MGADAVMLVTEWDAYRALDFDHLANAMRGEVIVDGRNALDGRAVAAAGLTWIGVGKPMMMPVRLLQRARPSLEWIRPAMIWAAAD
jgi:UDPglucose 6-dehydrogenase